MENLSKSDDQYGQCPKHSKRAYEFYCFDCNEAMCAMCIIDNKTEVKHHGHEIVELH